MTDRNFCHFGHFLPFSPLTSWKIKILQLKKKTPEDIIILHVCTVNDNHMMYGSWDMERNWQNFFTFWTFFTLLPPYAFRKSQFWNNEKNTWRYYHFTHVYHKWQSYHVLFLRYEVWWTEFFVILHCFCPSTPLTIWKIKILKNWK